MEKLFSVLTVFLLCTQICTTSFAAIQLPFAPASDTRKAAEEQDAQEAESYPRQSGSLNEGGSAVIETPLITTEGDPMPIRTLSQVRAVIGDDVEIINIDGLEVPLSDGSFAYIPFVDVAADAYYTKPVAWAYANDITAGVTEMSFSPSATCTRAQMITFLWRAAGCPEAADTASFTDVVSDSWYAQAVRWAVANGITNGVGDGSFDPNGVVTRAQAITFLYRAKGAPAAAAGVSFTDVAAGEYYADAVAWAVANGVTDGVGNNAFAPNSNCVRGQTVTFLYRTYAEA